MNKRNWLLLGGIALIVLISVMSVWLFSEKTITKKGTYVKSSKDQMATAEIRTNWYYAKLFKTVKVWFVIKGEDGKILEEMIYKSKGSLYAWKKSSKETYYNISGFALFEHNEHYQEVVTLEFENEFTKLIIKNEKFTFISMDE